MQKKKRNISRTKPIGTVESFGTQYRMLTKRGWIILDDYKEVEEENRRLYSFMHCCKPLLGEDYDV